MSRKVLVPLVATRGAVVTSGNTYRYYEIDGRRYSHVLNPRTGRPVANRIASATVVHPDGGTADGEPAEERAGSPFFDGTDTLSVYVADIATTFAVQALARALETPAIFGLEA